MMPRSCKRICKFGYLFFLIGIAGGFIGFGFLHREQEEYGPPNSMHCSAAVWTMQVSNIMLMALSLFGLGYLCCRVQFKFLAMMYILLLSTLLLFSAMSAVRTLTWFFSSDNDKITDMVEFTGDLFVSKNPKEVAISRHMRETQKRKKCCGIKSFTEWIHLYKRYSHEVRRVPDSCCVKMSRKCGYKMFLDLYSPVAYKNPNEPVEYPSQFNQDQFFKSSNQIPIYTNFPKDQLAVMNFSIMTKSMRDQKFAPCERKVAHQPVFFYLRKNYTHPELDIDPNHNYSYIVVNTWELCKNLSYPKLSEDDYLAWSLTSNGILHKEACAKYLIEYTAWTCIIVMLSAPVTALLVIIMMIVFHSYYWQYRRIQILNEGPPSWFEKIDSNDNVHVLGIAAQGSLDKLEETGEYVPSGRLASVEDVGKVKQNMQKTQIVRYSELVKKGMMDARKAAPVGTPFEQMQGQVAEPSVRNRQPDPDLTAVPSEMFVILSPPRPPPKPPEPMQMPYETVGPPLSAVLPPTMPATPVNDVSRRGRGGAAAGAPVNLPYAMRKSKVRGNATARLP